MCDFLRAGRCFVFPGPPGARERILANEGALLPREASMKAAPDAPIRTSATVLDRILTTGRPTLLVFETPGCEPCAALRPTAP